ncbi:branched-chain amino acid ABC transporter permease [Agrobacterium salinitolerans]|uniref:branched-chain amino acid ABC transporter permease n=1 Tax=Agrobacterium salinitolerans TaxID=1183413 RepID=UPI001573CB6A|nr:branched-chain amino acid ABC transporter permease [Agrobacterium salinitolerans]NTA40255.1 branched-chain amino acid ABC transporter permease [Agrobacterium salinitolerans]
MVWLNTVIQGTLLGGLYAMFAIGLSLIFGVMKLVNIAHGDLIVLSAYLALVVTQTMSVNPFVSLLIVVPIIAMVGYLLQRGLFNRTLGDDLLPPILVSFGLSIIIQNGLLLAFSGDDRRLHAGALEVASWRIGDTVAIGLLPLLQFVIAVAVIVVLHLLIRRTKTGRGLRAVSDDQAMAQVMGFNNRHMYGVAMALSLGITAVAGVLIAIRGNFDPSAGPARLIYGFEAVIIGGVGNIWGTLLGGIVLGVVQAIGGAIDPRFQILAGHLVFLLVLALRPSGLFGVKA